jgi:uncharacterized protein YcbK (DUF882 family)
MSKSLDRRRFLQYCAATTALSFSGQHVLAALPRSAYRQRVLGFYNTHTGEQLNIEYWAKYRYVPAAMRDINYLLRDHRTNDVYPIDPQLLDLLYNLRILLDTSAPIQVISGYRSPATNAMLAATTDGVSTHSLHMDGKAIDFNIPGRDLAQVRQAAMSFNSGGVGYYPASDFVHVDTGKVRYW